MNTNIYKPFPQSALIREWDKLLKLSREEVVQLHHQWEHLHKENEAIHRNHVAEKNTKMTEVVQYLKSVGIDVYKYKTKGFTKEKNGYQAWFKNHIEEEISKQFPMYQGAIPKAYMMEVTVEGIRLYNNVSPSNIVELYDRITFQYQSKIREVQKENKLLVKSMEYATAHGIDIEYLSTKQVIDTVSDHAKDEYRKEHLPKGTAVPLKHECDNCNTYFVGDHRCSCGNRKIAVIVEGDLIEGFYHYPEGC